MAYTIFEHGLAETPIFSETPTDSTTFNAQDATDSIHIPYGNIVQDSELSQDGENLILKSENGETITIQNYFSVENAPDLIGPNGMRLSPDLVDAFLQSPMKYTDAALNQSDASPIGAIQEITGTATITRANGVTEPLGLGTHIFQGDIIETDELGAVNIMFIDETTFAISEDARLSIDEYVFDPATQSGTTNFSILKGVFVFTSGLIGREDPDDVMINTPSGSIGIRGTIIAGDVDQGEVTVIEGAIVLYDFTGNSITLSNQFETARFNSSENKIEHIGDLSADDVASKFISISTVSADLFSSIQDAANDSTESTQSEANTAPDTPQTQANNQDAQEQNTQDQPTQGNQQAEQDTSEAAQNESEETQDLDVENSLEQTENEELDATSEQTGPSESETEAQNPAAEPLDVQPTQQQNPIDLPSTQSNRSARIADIKQTIQTRLANSTENTENIKDTVKTRLRLALEEQRDTNADQNITLTTTRENIDQNNENEDNTPIRETVSARDSAAPEFFSGSENTIFTYDFRQEFLDPRNEITSYKISGLSSPELSGNFRFNEQTGQLSFQLDNQIEQDSSFDFTITANTAENSIEQNFTFNVLEANTNGQGSGRVFILNDNAVYNITQEQRPFQINGENVTVFGNDLANSFIIKNTGTVIKSGGGDDTFDIKTNKGSFHLYGEQGDDTFNFIPNMDMENLNNNVNRQIDGGAGNDILKFSSTGNINFANLTPNLIKNIEQLDFTNKNSNTVTLRYSDVVRITDKTNDLQITIEEGDRLTFENDSDMVINGVGPGETKIYETIAGSPTLTIDIQPQADATLI